MGSQILVQRSNTKLSCQQTAQHPTLKLTSRQRVQLWMKAIKHAQVDQVKSLLKRYPGLIRAQVAEKIPYPTSIPADVIQILGEDTHNLTGLHYSLLYMIAEKSRKANTLKTSKTFEARSCIVALLIEHSTSGDINDLCWGFANTAMHLAALTGDESVIYNILNKGGESGASNLFGISALDIIDNTRNLQASWIHHSTGDSKQHSSTRQESFDCAERRGRSRQCKPLNDTVKYFRGESDTDFNRMFY
ncbi:hypothetical protein K493DRAFT_339628 [Basidiobolus meristosporus CBS 931.73]|uniref:Uncharacterized protein n=1 Tax=Basidiobolus meristosporus CBS 931.73 TaxID=1314790 RepID=A0A1Y1XZ36_9FUNG|nr:hypothetical protein K493DRAFT_339628 [Basidiobolus meristosporus CBS 931.73]|eukprot:ORX90998.1 hypothetical protein K493DRAFT_339628 [Basidiobolus meristosporus CBS 931.73]